MSGETEEFVWKCAGCGIEYLFMPKKRRGVRHCGESCRQRAYRSRKKMGANGSQETQPKKSRETIEEYMARMSSFFRERGFDKKQAWALAEFSWFEIHEKGKWPE